MSNSDPNHRPVVAGFNVPAIHVGKPNEAPVWKTNIATNWVDPDSPYKDVTQQIPPTGDGTCRAYPNKRINN